MSPAMEPSLNYHPSSVVCRGTLLKTSRSMMSTSINSAGEPSRWLIYNQKRKKILIPSQECLVRYQLTAFLFRHVKNIEFGNVEIASEKPDVRPAFWLKDVDGADFFRIKTTKGQSAPAFSLNDVKDFRVFGSRAIKDISEDMIEHKEI